MNRGANPEWAVARTCAHDIARHLEETLGRRLVAFMCDLRDPKAVGRWATGERKPRLENEETLRAIYAVVQVLAPEGPDIIRAWFIGLNPELGDETPAEIIRCGGTKAALIAARGYMRDAS